MRFPFIGVCAIYLFARYVDDDDSDDGPKPGGICVIAPDKGLPSLLPSYDVPSVDSDDFPWWGSSRFSVFS